METTHEEVQYLILGAEDRIADMNYYINQYEGSDNHDAREILINSLAEEAQKLLSMCEALGAEL